jgi:Common central domain of tyrosinase
VSQKKPKPAHDTHPAMNGPHQPGSPDMNMPATLQFDQNFQTFANHLSMLSPSIREIIKFPWWPLFPPTYERKDQAKLSDTEKQRFLCAFNILNQNGNLGQFVEVHSQPVHQMHHTLRFLPWHRIYLVKFEQALRSIHPDVAIPYWDWTQPAEQSIPAWLVGVTPTVVTPSRTINVVRAPGTTRDLAIIAGNTPNAISRTDSNTFSGSLEAIHDSVHVWVR